MKWPDVAHHALQSASALIVIYLLASCMNGRLL